MVVTVSLDPCWAAAANIQYFLTIHNIQYFSQYPIGFLTIQNIQYLSQFYQSTVQSLHQRDSRSVTSRPNSSSWKREEIKSDSNWLTKQFLLKKRRNENWLNFPPPASRGGEAKGLICGCPASRSGEATDNPKHSNIVILNLTVHCCGLFNFL